LETLAMVTGQEAAPARRLNPAVPRDLETIAAKCLGKEPQKRYASAQELADELGRYLGGEPIKARPVGAGERAAKWVRRNPALAAMAAVVFVALSMATVVSTLLALHAGEQATKATDALGVAKEQKGRADDEANNAKEALGLLKLQKKRADDEA